VIEERLNAIEKFIDSVITWTDLFGFDDMAEQAVEASVTLQSLREQILEEEPEREPPWDPDPEPEPEPKPEPETPTSFNFS